MPRARCERAAAAMPPGAVHWPAVEPGRHDGSIGHSVFRLHPPGIFRISISAATPPVSVDANQASFVARWYVLLMMVAVYTLSIADRYAISTVLEPIRLELRLTDSGIAF